MIIYSYDPKKNKKVKSGEIIYGIFTRKVSSKHFMRCLQAYGLSLDVIKQLKENKCNTVEIIKGKERYISSFNLWLNPLYSVTKNYGHGLQVFLPIANMKSKVI